MTIKKTSKKKLAVVLLLLMSLAFFTGCAGQSASTIKNPEQASDAVSDVSTDIEGVASALEDIDTKLG